MLLSLTLVACLLTSCLGQGEYLPEPRIVIVGQTGAGKSTLANVLLGESPDCKNCTFNVCDGHDSCTKNTKYAVGNWLGSVIPFTIVDTPGFGDSDNEDTELIDEMMGVLHTVIEAANAIVLLINGEEERFDASLQQMMREMQALFGEEFWTHTIIGVSHWAYDANSIAQRNFTNKTEENFMAEWNALLKGKFHIEEELKGVFIDSWSQQPWNQGDALQQEAFMRETDKLWTFSLSQDVFPFRTIEDVLDENQNLKMENQWLNDVITNNITELTNLIAALTTTHTDDMDEVSKDIKSVREDFLEDIAALTTIHTDDMDEIRDEISTMSMAPIGTIMAWTPKPNLDSNQAVALPDGWVECSGQVIEEGIWKGEKTPEINADGSAGLFLRGGHTGHALETEADQVKTLHYTDYTYDLNPGGYEAWGHNADGTCWDCGNDPGLKKTKIVSGSGGDETRPKNIRVVYIMKIK